MFLICFCFVPCLLNSLLCAKCAHFTRQISFSYWHFPLNIMKIYNKSRAKQFFFLIFSTLFEENLHGCLFAEAHKVFHWKERLFLLHLHCFFFLSSQKSWRKLLSRYALYASTWRKKKKNESRKSWEQEGKLVGPINNNHTA